MKIQWKEKRWEMLFLTAVFLLLVIWAAILPFDQAADERMRYNVVDYIVRHNALPHGDDPELRNEVWGISYAFNPILSYMVSALFVKVVKLFTDSFDVILFAARFVNVLLGTGTAYFVMKLGKKVFEGGASRMFIALAVFLPQGLFVFSYVNNDGLALFSGAVIIYMWALAMEDGWNFKICTGLSVGIALLALSYYNAYGWALTSVLFFAATVLGGKKKWDFKTLFGRGFFIALLVLLLAGWWFARNYVIYDGDFLGQASSRASGILYAQEPYKPGNLFNGEKLGQGLLGMFFYQDPGWEHNWLVMVAVGFVGLFGRMDLYMPYWWSKLYFLVFAVGFLGVIVNYFPVFSFRGGKRLREVRNVEGGKVLTRVTLLQDHLSSKSIFHWCLLIGMVIPFILLCIYSYSSDMQAQGRYILPMTIPFMYFVTLGYQFLLNRLVKNGRIREMVCNVLAAAAALSALLVFLTVVVPAYIG